MCDGFWNHTMTSSFVLDINILQGKPLIVEYILWCCLCYRTGDFYVRMTYTTWLQFISSSLLAVRKTWCMVSRRLHLAMCDAMFAVNIVCILPSAIHETMVHFLQDNISLILLPSLFQLVQSKPVQKSTNLRQLIWVWYELKKRV